MKRLLTIVAMAAFLTHATPVSDIGALRVVGNQIQGADGEVAQLRGMSLYWSQSRSAKDFYNAAAISSIATDWHANVVRIAMAVGDNWSSDEQGYISDPATQKARVNTVVQAAIDLGLYVIIDFHSHDASQYQVQAIAFFKEMATQWGTHPNVIYEIWNEPIGSSDSTGAVDYWKNTIKPYSQAVVAAIRAIDSDNLIILGTPFYDQYVDVATANPLTGVSNVAYAFHFYASEASHEALKARAERALANNQAVFVTEWGFSPASGNGSIDQTASQGWLQWMEKNKLSSCNWSFSDKNESSAAFVAADEYWDGNLNQMVARHNVSTTGPWSDNDLTASGKLIREYLRTYNPPYSSSTPVLSASRAGDVTLYRQGAQLVLELGNTSWNRVEVRNAEGRLLTAQSLASGERQVHLTPRNITPGIVYVHLSGTSQSHIKPMVWVD